MLEKSEIKLSHSNETLQPIWIDKYYQYIIEFSTALLMGSSGMGEFKEPILKFKRYFWFADSYTRSKREKLRNA